MSTPPKKNLFLNKVIQRYHRSFNYYGKKSSANFVRYLEANGVKVGENVLFRYPKSTTIDLTRPSLIEIGDNVDINANFTIMTHDFGCYVLRNLYKTFVASSGRVKLGNNIYIGRNVTILKGVEIGDNCIIGLGSVVTHSIPTNSVAVGVPAKVISDIGTYYNHRKERQIEEALTYGVSIYNRYGRIPVPDDFSEEWTVFVDKEDIIRYPILNSYMKSRLRDNYSFFWDNHNPPFKGFSEFINEIKSRII